MGCNCTSPNLQSKSIEESIREIIYELKIAKLTLKEYSELLSEIFQYKNSENSTKQLLSEIFYESNPNLNPYHNIHKEIFEFYYNLIKDFLIVEYILLVSFPYLKKNSDRDNKYFFAILNEIYSDKFSYNFINLLFLKIFEQFSYKITKIIFVNTQNEEIKKNCYYVIKQYFKFEIIEKRVVNLLNSFDQLDKNEKNLDINDLVNFFENKNVFHFSDIRDFLINGDFQK